MIHSMKRSKIMKDQKQFFRDINKWVKNGCPDYHPIFTRHGGLCVNYSKWCEIKGKKDRTPITHLTMGFNNPFPFNDGKCDSYVDEIKSCTIYNNPARLEFIKIHSR